MKALRCGVPLLVSSCCVVAAVAATPVATDPGIEGYTVDGARVAPLQFNGDLRNLPKALSTPPSPKYFPLRRQPPQARALPEFHPAAPAARSGPAAPMPATQQNFRGISFTDTCAGGQCGAGWPPDTNGDVGPNHYILAVNDAFGIYSKTGAALVTFTHNQFWSGIGSTPCNGNSQGDPIVVYDALADRWILTQFAFAVVAGEPVGPFYQCIAVSKTGDPVAGGWYFYPLRMDPGTPGTPPVGALNDYAKFGIWNDCLYMAANEFVFPGENFLGTAFASFSRADMVAGLPLTWSLGFINNAVSPFTMLPSNASGKAAVAIPPGTPNYFVSESTTDFKFEVRKFTPGANCGGGGTLGAPALVAQDDYDYVLPNAPQPNTSNTLDTLGDRLMQKAQYRKVGTQESLWVVHTVQSLSGILAPQWAQIDVTGKVVAATPVQQQIHAPDNVLHRWMGSLAVDGHGNMALGYSTSNGSPPNFPSIAYAGRLAIDPPNILPQTEQVLIAGSGSQTNKCGGAPCERWGDYTAMSVDPVDDCTFWYTNQYYSSPANGATGNWQTRIGSFRFPSCSGGPPTTTTLSSSANPSTVGMSVTLNAAVTGAAPTGTVNFKDSGTDLIGCAAVALTGSGNTRLATCNAPALLAGTRVMAATYTGDSANAASIAGITQVVGAPAPGTGTIIANPYGPLVVTGATLSGPLILDMQPVASIQLGNVSGAPGSFIEVDFLGLNIAPGGVISVVSGAPGQTARIVNANQAGSAIAGTLRAQGGNGAAPPVLVVGNSKGIDVYAGGSIVGTSGLMVDALGGNFNTGQTVVNAGTLDGGGSLEVLGANINGGGAFKGNAITLRTFGSANNPANGAFFLLNSMQLFPGSGNTIAVTLNAYGPAPQAINVMTNGNATVSMPSAWPAGVNAPPNNAVVPPGAARAAGVPDPAYGGGSLIVQSTGTLTLAGGTTNDFVFPGGIVLKANGTLDLNGVLLNQGWTTAGKSFQGMYVESPNIVNPTGNIRSYSNGLNWLNFSTLPHAPVRAFTLVRNADGTASYATADATAPHLNTYSILSNAAASGACWTCLVNTTPVNMFGP